MAGWAEGRSGNRRKIFRLQGNFYETRVKCGVRRAACGVRRAACGVRRAACGVRRAACEVYIRGVHGARSVTIRMWL
ncbi:hypothetical protein EBQ25_06305 [Allofranklinella schreckenbergeri]|uniref:Uncharacterized protein n=1 Tax=Allofranklinella schreckenbergeri TaxID=1076744 RepID=A0A3M6QB45_9BURK|nr:hypothetical protein EBQ25_06305 [Allofranklinella schreckenbergeri]